MAKNQKKKSENNIKIWVSDGSSSEMKFLQKEGSYSFKSSQEDTSNIIIRPNTGTFTNLIVNGKNTLDYIPEKQESKDFLEFQKEKTNNYVVTITPQNKIRETQNEIDNIKASILEVPQYNQNESPSFSSKTIFFPNNNIPPSQQKQSLDNGSQIIEKEKGSEETPNFLDKHQKSLQKRSPTNSPKAHRNSIERLSHFSSVKPKEDEKTKSKQIFLVVDEHSMIIPLNLHENVEEKQIIKDLNSSPKNEDDHIKNINNQYKIQINSEKIFDHLIKTDKSISENKIQPPISSNDLLTNPMDLPDIPSRFSLIKAIEPTRETLPSIMINNELVLLNNTQNGEPLSNLSLESNYDSKDDSQNQNQMSAGLANPNQTSSTPKSLQDLGVVELTFQHHRKSNSNNSLYKKSLIPPKTNQKVPNNKNLQKPIVLKKLKQNDNKFKRKQALRLNKSSIILKRGSEFSENNSGSNSGIMQKENINSLKRDNDDSVLLSRASESKLFPQELVLDFRKKNKIYSTSKKFENNKTTPEKNANNQKYNEIKKFHHNKCRLTFFSFNEKVKRFFERHYQTIYPERTPLSSSLPKISLKKDSAKSQMENNSNENKSPNKVLGSNRLLIRNDSQYSIRYSHKNESNLSNNIPNPEINNEINLLKTDEHNFRQFSKSYRQGIVHSQTPKNNSSEVLSNETNIIDKDSSILLREGVFTEDYNGIIQKIELKMKEHDEILSSNYIFFNQKNIRTLFNEEFFIFLENMLASNYFVYISYKFIQKFFSLKIRKTKLSSLEPLIRKSRTQSLRLFNHRSSIMKYCPKIQEITTFENRVYTLKEDENFNSFSDYLQNSDFKQLKMVIDEEIDETLLDDNSSPLFDKMPSGFDHSSLPLPRKRSLILDNRKLFKSKFLSASTPTNHSEEREEFYRDEDEYFFEHTDLLKIRAKDRIYLEYFRDVQKKAFFFSKYLEENTLCFITRFEPKQMSEKLLHEKLVVDPKTFAKVEEENEKSI